LIVISDTSPILNLSLIGRLELLVSLYEQVFIPPAVYRELTRSDVAPPLIEGASCAWLVVEPAQDRSRVAQLREDLDPGEAEAIALALEKRADLILLDERLGRQVAMALGLRVTGLLGVLAEAKRARLIERVNQLSRICGNALRSGSAPNLSRRFSEISTKRDARPYRRPHPCRRSGQTLCATGVQMVHFHLPHFSSLA
jgi:uncharacterized protein